ncbi:MAG: CapA family protein [Deltaproteobacteria bacterium]|nr:CapA family protein [Deltaproteobacteria bacterium]
MRGTRWGALTVAALVVAVAAVARPQERLTVAAVGDLMLGTTYPTDLLPPEDAATAFDPVAAALRGHDVLFGNLEGPLLDGGTSAKCPKENAARCFEFRMPRRYARRLASAGFHALNIANNHAFDFGREGVESTVAALAEAGIQAVGGERVARLQVRGRRVAILGFSTSPPSPYSASILDLERARTLVAAARAENDLVIVSFHGGAEGKGAQHVADQEEFLGTESRGNVLRFARAVVDAGADLVLGHGPHVPRAMELRRGKLIAYSLGNFLTYGRFNTKGPSGLGYVLAVELDAATGDFVAGRIVSVALSEPGLPAPDPGDGAAALVQSLTAADLGGGGLAFREQGRFGQAARDRGGPGAANGGGLRESPVPIDK